MESYAYPAARKFRKVLQQPEFTIEVAEPYWNRFGVQGYCQVGRFRHRLFCVSQSKSEEPDPPAKLCRVFTDENVDPRQPVLFRNRHGRLAVQVVAWYGSRWYKMFTPQLQPDWQSRVSIAVPSKDEFTELADRVMNDHDHIIGKLDWEDTELDILIRRWRELGGGEF
jgi:hypothetical protein